MVHYGECGSGVYQKKNIDLLEQGPREFVVY